MDKRRGRGPGRKKYAELIRFLKSVIKDERIGLRVRMSAAERLDGIYSRHEQREILELKKAERIAAGAQDAPGDPEEQELTLEQPPDPQRALQEARAFLARTQREATNE